MPRYHTVSLPLAGGKTRRGVIVSSDTDSDAETDIRSRAKKRKIIVLHNLDSSPDSSVGEVSGADEEPVVEDQPEQTGEPSVVTIRDTDEESVDDELLNALLDGTASDAGSPPPTRGTPPPPPPTPPSPFRETEMFANTGRVFHLKDQSPGVKVRCDVDSYVIMARDLRAFAPPVNFCISLENAHAGVCHNKKALDILQDLRGERDDGPPRYRFREFVLGGHGPETIYVLYRIEMERDFQEHCARWKYHKSVTFEAIQGMPRLSRTRSHTPSKIETYGKTQLRVFEEDWLSFAESMMMANVRPCGVDVFYYKSLHGLKLDPRRAINVINGLIGDYRRVCFVQIHHGVEFAKDGAMITFDLKNVRRMTDGETWEATTTYRKYFLRGGFGHFSGLKHINDFEQVSYAQGYEPEAHLLPGKRSPPAWMRKLFNGMKLAPAGGRLSAYGSRMANDTARVQAYFERIQDVGIAARFEAVCTYYEHIRPRMYRDTDIGRQFAAKLYENRALVVITDFANIVRRGRFGVSRLRPEKYETTPYPEGCLVPKQHLECAMDQAVLRHVWVQGYGQYTDAPRYHNMMMGRRVDLGATHEPENGARVQIMRHSARSGVDCRMTPDEIRRLYDCPTNRYAEYLALILQYIDNVNRRPRRVVGGTDETADGGKSRLEPNPDDDGQGRLWTPLELTRTHEEAALDLLNLLGLYAREMCGLRPNLATGADLGCAWKIFTMDEYEAAKGVESHLGPDAVVDEVTKGIVQATHTYGVLAICACYADLEKGRPALEKMIAERIEVFPAKLWGRPESKHFREWNPVKTLRQIADREKIIRPSELQITPYARGRMNLARYRTRIKQVQKENEQLALRCCGQCQRDLDAVRRSDVIERQMRVAAEARRLADQVTNEDLLRMYRTPELQAGQPVFGDQPGITGTRPATSMGGKTPLREPPAPELEPKIVGAIRPISPEVVIPEPLRRVVSPSPRDTVNGLPGETPKVRAAAENVPQPTSSGQKLRQATLEHLVTGMRVARETDRERVSPAVRRPVVVPARPAPACESPFDVTTTEEGRRFGEIIGAVVVARRNETAAKPLETCAPASAVPAPATPVRTTTERIRPVIQPGPSTSSVPIFGTPAAGLDPVGRLRACERKSLDEYIAALQNHPPRQQTLKPREPLSENELLVIFSYGMENLHDKINPVRGDVFWKKAAAGRLQLMNRPAVTMRNTFGKLAVKVVAGDIYTRLVTEQELESLKMLFAKRKK